ncbi:MAG: DMT family transporter [Candidatus Latescibacterota bacterium]
MALACQAPRPLGLRADGLLLLAATIWGFAFVAQRLGMEHTGPFLFNAVRFALGSLTVLPFLRAAPPVVPPSRKERLGGCLLAGVLLFLGASLQQVGMVYTTAGKAGFITGLYVVIVPLMGLLFRQFPARGTWAGAGVATVGLYLLSVAAGLALAPGDGLVLVGAFCWAGHVLVIGRYSGRLGWSTLALAQYTTCSALSFAAAFLTEQVELAGLLAVVLPLLYGGVLSTGVAHTLQVAAQAHAPAAHAAIILSLEAVFAALGGWLLLGESFTARGLAGCGLMLAGMLLSQLDEVRARRR